MAAASKPRLTYFPIEAVAEKVRLAFVVTGTDFDDVRVKMGSEEWKSLKPKTPNGQLPVLENADGFDGRLVGQSGAMLRWVARKYDSTNTLYPADPTSLLHIEEMIGLLEDMQRSWGPALYIGMRPQRFGYPEDFDGEEKEKLVKQLREKWLAEELPGFMQKFDKVLENSPFLCGSSVTIADLWALPQFRYYVRGIADHVPADCLNPYTSVQAWMQRMYSIPAIKDWYKM